MIRVTARTGRSVTLNRMSPTDSSFWIPLKVAMGLVFRRNDGAILVFKNGSSIACHGRLSAEQCLIFAVRWLDSKIS